MRSFEEIKAEVFRRSEEIIKKRKQKKKRVISVGVPLCAALLVCSLMLLPPIINADKGVAPEDMADSNAVFASLEINGYNLSEKITDTDKINQIYLSLIESRFDTQSQSTDSNSALKDEAMDFSDSSSEEDSVEKSGLELCFKMSDGKEIKFIMTDVQLYNADSGIKTHLSEKRMQELLALLGLTD